MSSASSLPPRGRIDGILDGRLRGWLWDPARPEEVLTAEILVDGEPVASLPAALRRGDLQRAGIGNGAHGFDWRLPPALSARGDIRVSLRTRIGGQLLVLDQRDIPAAEHQAIMGRLEEPRRGRLVGWAYDPAHPARHLRVTLQLPDGASIPVLANRRRGDLQRAGIGDGSHGFEIPLTALPLDGMQELEVSAVVRDGGAERLIGRRRLTPSADLLCDLAEAAMILGRYEEAEERLVKAATLDPASPRPHLTLAELHEGQADATSAIAALSQALTRAPAAEQDLIRERLGELRRRQAVQSVPALQHWPATHPRTMPEGPRIGVISWDLAHNPLGRAWVLAELGAHLGPTEIVGPLFPAFGTSLWAPLRDSDRGLSISGYMADGFASFVNGAIRLVLDHPCDIAWVCKPRFPGLFIGLLQRLIHGARILVDIDDDELAFVHAEEPLTLDTFLAESGPEDWKDPYGTRWTRLAQSMIGWGDAVTVCNPVLQARHGGIIIRHARDEAAYDPARIDRQAVRAEFGFGEDDKVVLFLGTPRRHKGLIEVAEALRELGDPRVVLCIIGTIADRELRGRLLGFGGLRVSLHPDQPFRRAAELNAMADLVCLLQDPESPIAQSQTPAKLTDALAVGTPVLARAAPPLNDLLPGAMQEGEDITQALRRALEAGRGAVDGRAVFLQELSYAANLPRAREALEAARAATDGVPQGFLRLLAHLDQHMPGLIEPDLTRHLGGAIPAFPRIGRLASLEEGINIAFFWKQNDSGLYGRRQDMLLEQLERLPSVRRILHVDAPISADKLEAMSGSRAPSQHRFGAGATLQRFLRLQDRGKVHRRVFLHAGRNASVLGQPLPHRALFPQAVGQWLRELDMTSNLLAWVCPVVPMFPEVQARLGFSFIVSDVIDDQRQWPMRPGARAEMEANYRATFAASDLLLANCAPVAEWMEAEGFRPLLVPNGMELHEGVEGWPVPSALSGLPRPIIGYAGNLQDRVDWELIAGLADARPGWSFVLIGATPGDTRAAEAMARPNIHATGVVPYAEAKAHIAAFDAAIIPHLRTGLSERMNPLKLYVYRSLGLPVVSTPIANLEDLAGEIRIAATPEDFLSALDGALEERRRGRIWPEPARMRALSWESRMQAIMAGLRDAFARKGAAP
ncbi:glycosyltransferase [Roseomonas sp. SSH11]|uniref:Glycosyltransferase n=1 Tax=Pararoseomonas baculiformis TaxID=2820812 RepID=A0ABS4ALC8_9PROT|nr:glycosyltransferase [Pararoseomonas baculiformis]MBP0447009.1 glycosyltransferase [Pararoseomonas baculiformis]